MLNRVYGIHFNVKYFKQEKCRYFYDYFCKQMAVCLKKKKKKEKTARGACKMDPLLYYTGTFWMP